MPIRIHKKEVVTALVFFFIGVSAAQFFEESSVLKENRKAAHTVVNLCNNSLQYSKQLQDNLYASFVTVSNCFGKGEACDRKKLWIDISALDDENARLNERLDREKKDLEQATQAVKR